MLVRIDASGRSVTVDAWLAGPVSPRTPMSQYEDPATHWPVVVWLAAVDPLALCSATTCCWFRVPVPNVPTAMLNERFCQKMSFQSSGYETVLQVPLTTPVVPVPPPWKAGQVMLAGKFATRVALFCTLTRPATCGHDAVVLPVWMQLLCWVLAKGAPMVLNSGPAEAVLSFDTIVLLMMLTFNASSSDTPAPSQPATLLTMMLL